MAYFTTTDGVRIYYEEHGTGQPLLLAYGIGGNAGHVAAECGRPRRPAPPHPVGAPEPRALGGARRPHSRHLRPLGARSPRSPRPSRPRPRGGGRALAGRRASPPASSSSTPTACARSRGGGLVVGGGAAAQRRQRGDAGAQHPGRARGRHGRHGRVRHRVEPQRLRAAQARSPGARGSLRDVPDAQAHRVRQCPARPAADGLHHRAPVRRSPRPPCSSAATRIPRSGRCG